MLKLRARRKGIVTGRYRRLVSDTVPPTECRQRGIRQLRAACHQLFMDSHEVPLAAVEKL